MNQGLSVLIPTYNVLCVSLVEQLYAQLVASGIAFEIIVADDGSTQAAVIEGNRAITRFSGCQYIERKENVGRAAIRNFLVQKAQYESLLFIDSDMTMLSDQFISRYLACKSEGVIDGGIAVCPSPNEIEQLQHNLRYRYEKSLEPQHTAIQRQQRAYQHIHTANLWVPRSVMLENPFDERIRNYGYEDVLLGKQLHKQHIPILHIDNPMGFSTFETNEQFVAKTEEGLRTLYQFRSDLRGYSRLLTFVSGIHIPLILWLIRLGHQLFSKAERRNLCSLHPSLLIFKLYRLGYYLSLGTK